MMGGPMRMKRVRLSRKTWMNSLISICFSRPSIGSPLRSLLTGSDCDLTFPQGLKTALFPRPFAARLKPCPFKASTCFRGSLGEPLVKRAGGQQRQHKSEDSQRDEIGREHGGGGALKKDLLQYRNVIASGENARDPLQWDGHLLDGKEKAGEQEGRKKCDEQCNLAGGKLILGEHGDEEAEREHHHHKHGGTD